MLHQVLKGERAVVLSLTQGIRFNPGRWGLSVVVCVFSWCRSGSLALPTGPETCMGDNVGKLIVRRGE